MPRKASRRRTYSMRSARTGDDNSEARRRHDVEEAMLEKALADIVSDPDAPQVDYARLTRDELEEAIFIMRRAVDGTHRELAHDRLPPTLIRDLLAVVGTDVERPHVFLLARVPRAHDWPRDTDASFRAGGLGGALSSCVMPALVSADANCTGTAAVLASTSASVLVDAMLHVAEIGRTIHRSVMRPEASDMRCGPDVADPAAHGARRRTNGDEGDGIGDRMRPLVFDARTTGEIEMRRGPRGDARTVRPLFIEPGTRMYRALDRLMQAMRDAEQEARCHFAAMCETDVLAGCDDPSHHLAARVVDIARGAVGFPALGDASLPSLGVPPHGGDADRSAVDAFFEADVDGLRGGVCSGLDAGAWARVRRALLDREASINRLTALVLTQGQIAHVADSAAVGRDRMWNARDTEWGLRRPPGEDEGGESEEEGVRSLPLPSELVIGRMSSRRMCDTLLALRRRDPVFLIDTIIAHACIRRGEEGNTDDDDDYEKEDDDDDKDPEKDDARGDSRGDSRGVIRRGKEITVTAHTSVMLCAHTEADRTTLIDALARRLDKARQVDARRTLALRLGARCRRRPGRRRGAHAAAVTGDGEKEVDEAERDRLRYERDGGTFRVWRGPASVALVHVEKAFCALQEADGSDAAERYRRYRARWAASDEVGAPLTMESSSCHRSAMPMLPMAMAAAGEPDGKRFALFHKRASLPLTAPACGPVEGAPPLADDPYARVALHGATSRDRIAAIDEGRLVDLLSRCFRHEEKEKEKFMEEGEEGETANPAQPTSPPPTRCAPIPARGWKRPSKRRIAPHRTDVPGECDDSDRVRPAPDPLDHRAIGESQCAECSNALYGAESTRNGHADVDRHHHHLESEK